MLKNAQQEEKAFVKICEGMTHEVELTTPDETLQDAARKMRDSGVGILPVGENDRLVGVITDRDIAVRAVAKGLDPKSTRVRDAMTPQVLYCFEDQPVSEAAQMMEKRAVRRLIVMSRRKRMVGLISLDDLAKLPGEERRVGEVLERVSEPRPLATANRNEVCLEEDALFSRPLNSRIRKNCRRRSKPRCANGKAACGRRL
jgi:CBS domain-containing protein